MKYEQRRDHPPRPGLRDLCETCGEQLIRVYDRGLTVASRRHFRHQRSWHVAPWS